MYYMYVCICIYIYIERERYGYGDRVGFLWTTRCITRSLWRFNSKLIREDQNGSPRVRIHTMKNPCLINIRGTTLYYYYYYYYNYYYYYYYY